MHSSKKDSFPREWAGLKSQLKLRVKKGSLTWEWPWSQERISAQSTCTHGQRQAWRTESQLKLRPLSQEAKRLLTISLYSRILTISLHSRRRVLNVLLKFPTCVLDTHPHLFIICSMCMEMKPFRLRSWRLWFGRQFLILWDLSCIWQLLIPLIVAATTCYYIGSPNRGHYVTPCFRHVYPEF
jgi:hypothetical protein